MELKDLGFGVFGVAAFVEIVALVAAVKDLYHSMMLFYVIGAAAIIALGSLGFFVFETWRNPTSDHESHTTH